MGEQIERLQDLPVLATAARPTRHLSQEFSGRERPGNGRRRPFRGLSRVVAGDTRGGLVRGVRAESVIGVVYAVNTDITADGARRFRNLLPDCTVHV